MDDRRALMLEWLEGEGERQRRPVLPLPQAKDPALRGWVQVGVCGLVGTLVTAILVCLLTRAREQAMRVAFTERLHQEGFRIVTGDPNSSRLPSAESRGVETSARTNVVALGILLCVILFAVAFGTLSGAVFLRAACGFYNMLAGGKASPTSVPEPLFCKALGIMLATILVSLIAEFVLGVRFGKGAAVIPQLLFLTIPLLVMAVMNCALLPTTFFRGVGVALCYFLVMLFVIVVLGALS
jgi:hypothetical protein